MKTASDDRLDVLREQVEEKEQELHVALEELEGAARRTFDVGRRIRQHPWLWLGAAFLAGAYVGSMFGNREGARG
jgi:hypothetical protein